MSATVLLSGLAAHVTARARIRRLNAELALARHRLHHDPLTGLGNRSLLHHDLNRPHPAGLTLALIDIDGLDAVNQQHGYRAGDELLVLYAGRLRHLAHTGGATAYRLRGDEFAVVLPAADASPLAALLADLAQPLDLHSSRPPATVAVTTTVGIAHAGARGTPRVLLHHADLALRQAKQHPAGGVTDWTDDAHPAGPASLPGPQRAPGRSPRIQLHSEGRL